MKHIIEIELPDGQAVPTAEDIARLTDLNWISAWWHIDDVKEVYLGDEEYDQLTDDEAREVLRRAKKYHDCDVGLNWEVFSDYADDLYAERKNNG